MKQQIIVGLLVIFTSVNIVTAQDVQVGGKTFKVSKKTQLNKGTEFYQLKEKTNSAVSQSYIKTNGVFKKTVFTEQELKNFFAKGTVSSLGKVSKMTVGKRKVTYISKKNVDVLFAIKDGQLLVVEFQGDIKVLMSDNPGGPSDDRLRCGAGCSALYEECNEEFGPQDEDSSDPCFVEFILCIYRCDDAFPMRTNTSSYKLDASGLPIKMN